jgi:TrmH family RNA methyltransferase
LRKSKKPELSASEKERLKYLDNVRVVLVSPKFPGNLGMTARSMKNCGFSDLRLVGPRAEINKEAYMLALSGGDLLDRAIIHKDLAEAVADCGLVAGTSRRTGVLRRNAITPEEFVDLAKLPAEVGKIAVVFGSEDCGLSTEDLNHCQWIVSMHTGSEFESFNLSHSVAIVMYLLTRAILGVKKPPRLALSKNLEAMFGDISRFLLETGFIHEKDPKRMMAVVRQILHRSGMNEREVRIIRGILRQTRWRIENPKASLDPRDTPQWLRRGTGRKDKEEDDEEN